MPKFQLTPQRYARQNILDPRLPRYLPDSYFTPNWFNKI